MEPWRPADPDRRDRRLLAGLVDASLLDAAFALSDAPAQKTALEAIIPDLGPTARAHLHERWREYLAQARREERSRVFASLVGMTPTIAVLTGDEGDLAATAAIGEIGASWP